MTNKSNMTNISKLQNDEIDEITMFIENILFTDNQNVSYLNDLKEKLKRVIYFLEPLQEGNDIRKSMNDFYKINYFEDIKEYLPKILNRLKSYKILKT